jgi:ankyrin repeat protein
LLPLQVGDDAMPPPQNPGIDFDLLSRLEPESRNGADDANPAANHVQNGGKLFLEVVSAENLTWSLLGKPNAFVTIELDGQLKRTATRLADCHPTWNAGMVLDVVEYFGSAQVIVKVWDRSLFGDQCLGTIRIPLLSCLPPSKAVSHQGWGQMPESPSQISGVGSWQEAHSESDGDFFQDDATDGTNRDGISAGSGHGNGDVVGDNFRRVHDASEQLKRTYTIDEWFVIPDLNVPKRRGNATTVNTSRVVKSKSPNVSSDSLERESDWVVKGDKRRRRSNTGSSRDENDVDDESLHIHSSGISGIQQSLMRMFHKTKDDRRGDEHGRADQTGGFSLPTAAASAFCCTNAADENPTLALDPNSRSPRKSQRQRSNSAFRKEKVNAKKGVVLLAESQHNLRPRLRVRVRYVPLSKCTQSQHLMSEDNSLLSTLGMSEVHCAAMFGHTQLLLSMAEAMTNAYPNMQVLSARCSRPGLRWTALDYAAAFRHHETVKALIKRGHQGLLLLGKSPTTFATPLHLSVHAMDIKLVQIVAEAMLKTFEKENRHARVNRMLRRASGMGGGVPAPNGVPELQHFEDIQIDQQQNTDLNDDNNPGATTTEDLDNAATVPELAPDDGEGLALDAQLAGNVPAEEEAPPSPLDACDSNGNTALAIACRVGFLSGVVYLLETGVNISIANQLRYFCILPACIYILCALLSCLHQPIGPFLFFLIFYISLCVRP